jgi:glycosyltransferase involved in cell wall biosynthesis
MVSSRFRLRKWPHDGSTSCAVDRRLPESKHLLSNTRLSHPAGVDPGKPRVAYVVNHAAFFASHRLPLALAARDAGYSVALFTGEGASREMEQRASRLVAGMGIVHSRSRFRSSGMNPWVELLGLLNLCWQIFRFQPSIVHCASPKGLIYGGIAGRIVGARVVFAVSGMGYAFTDTPVQSATRLVARSVYSLLVRVAVGRSGNVIVVQNADDEREWMSRPYASACRVTLIPGSGVDFRLYPDDGFQSKQRIVMLPARMLRDKGVVEFVKAARHLREKFPEWAFVLAGAADYDNPSAITDQQLNEWQTEGSIQWLGHVQDIAALYMSARIVCLPSYREGMPKALLEAAAAACAVVTTDAVGCREAIIDGETGLLVPVGDVGALVRALSRLMEDDELTAQYGRQGRARARQIFSLESINAEILKIYEDLTANE